jgi:hypothetical protein
VPQMPDSDLERLHEVLGRVTPKALGKPEGEVRELLQQELREAGLTWSQEASDGWVRAVAGAPSPSLWRLLTSVARRLTRKHEAEVTQPVDPLTPEQSDLQRLADRLLTLPGVSHVGWDSGHSDHAIEVTVDPWSDEIAEQVRQHAALAWCGLPTCAVSSVSIEVAAHANLFQSDHYFRVTKGLQALRTDSFPR